MIAPEDRFAIVPFSGAAFLQCPLTSEESVFRQNIEAVRVGTIPMEGTSLSRMIETAAEAFVDEPTRQNVLVIFTDGEDHESFPAEAASEAARRDVRMITVGLGDQGEGARIPQRGEDGNRVFLQHKGQEVWSKMDERLLKEMALTTKGAYIPAQTRAYDLGRIYDDHLVNLNRGEVLAEKRKRYREQFQLLGGVGLLLLLIEMVISSYPTRTGDAEGSFS